MLKYIKKPVFWIWIILFFIIYKKTYFFIIIIIYVWLKIIIILITKKIIVKNNIIDLFILSYLNNLQNLNKKNIYPLIFILLINFFLTFSVGLLKLWIEFFDISYQEWKFSNMKNKKKYINYYKKCLFLFKENIFKIDPKITNIKKIKVFYKF